MIATDMSQRRSPMPAIRGSTVAFHMNPMRMVVPLALVACVGAGPACNNKQREGKAPSAPATEETRSENKGSSARSGGDRRVGGIDDSGRDSCQLVKSAVTPREDGTPKVEVVAQGLEVPWGLAFLPGGDILVTERPGRLRRVHQGRLDPPPVATWDIDPAGEGGVLGVALHPDFANNSLVFIYVTKEAGGRTFNQVERWRYDRKENRATMAGVVLGDIPAARFHNGGRLRVGHDGMLYIGTGDAGEPQLSQQRDSLAGKVLRIQPNGDIPRDNPWPNVAAFLLGLRNTHGFDWISREQMVVTDHGPSGELGRRGHDEVTIVVAGDNLGWPTIYGCEKEQGLVAPSLTWERAVPPGGAAYYTGDAIPEWKDSLVIGVLGDKHLHRVVFDDIDVRRVARHEVYFRGDPPSGYGRLREVIQGPDGALYVTTSNCDGRGKCPPEKDRILKLTG